MNAAEQAALRRARWLRLRQGSGALVLLSFVTSTSLNYARLVRERREERREHAIQCRVLSELHDQLVAAPSTSRVTLDEQQSLAARLRSVHLDPRNIGIKRGGKQRQTGASSLEDDDEEEHYIESVRQAHTSWSTILFGGDGVGGRIKRALSSTVDAIRRGEGPNDQREGEKSLTQKNEEAAAEEAWLRELDRKYNDEAPDKGADPSHSPETIAIAREDVRRAGLATEYRPRLDSKTSQLQEAPRDPSAAASAEKENVASAPRRQILM